MYTNLNEIKGAYLRKLITLNEAILICKCVLKSKPLCIGAYNHQISDCQRQDLRCCQVCKKLAYYRDTK